MESLVKRVEQQSLQEWSTNRTRSQSTIISVSLADEAQEDAGLSQPYNASPRSSDREVEGDEFLEGFDFPS